MGRWKFSCRAIDPKNTDVTWEIGVSAARYKRLLNQGDEVRRARLTLVKQVLDDPIAIYRGWGRPDTDEKFIYVGLPDGDVVSLVPLIEEPAPRGMVFLVLVLPDGTIDSWNWRPCDPENPSVPQGVDGDPIWPSTKNY